VSAGTEPVTAGTERVIAWCAWHLDLVDDAALVQPATDTDGSGFHACHRCRETYRLTPWEHRL
jgi:hypothetical protein